MVSTAEIFSLNNPVYNTYLFYCAVLGGKMLLMSLLTGRQRFRKGAFASPEDISSKAAKVRVDEDVERVRRGHLNDLENIPVFMIVCGVYLLTQPAPFVAQMLIRAFACARIMHTIVYTVVVIPQPARALSWAVAYFITWYMVVMCVLKFLPFM